jgi:hypothetical protein
MEVGEAGLVSWNVPADRQGPVYLSLRVTNGDAREVSEKMLLDVVPGD